MFKPLLPPNSQGPEFSLEEAGAVRVEGVPVPVRDMWSPDTCPASLLPWLAWALSVDEWDDAWTVDEKREVIRQSIYVHKHKGTIGAMDRALRPLGYLIDVVEWWEMEPPGDPYTFSVVIGSTGKPVEDNLYPRLERLIEASKNLRSHLAGITVKADVSGKLYVASALQSGEETTVYPYQISEQQVSGVLYYAAALQIIDTVSVGPQS